MDDKMPSGENGKTRWGETGGGVFVYVGPRVAGVGYGGGQPRPSIYIELTRIISLC